jgi:amino-acid N-acetyltransferase
MWENMAEIKSLAVKQEYHTKGYGKQLVQAALDECPGLGVKKVFALTYVPDFFSKFGFERGEKESMPHKIWSECINCPHFPDCDEVLVVRDL